MAKKVDVLAKKQAEMRRFVKSMSTRLDWLLPRAA